MSTTDIWQQYEQGVDYKARIGLYRTVDLNERFFAGDQWVGVPHEGLPTPVVNFIKYASAWKIAAVTERRLGMQFFADGLSDGGDIGIYAKQVSAYCDMLWERLKMDYVTKEGLKQAAITGDYVQYFYWDPELCTGQAVTGDIATQLIDNVDYYPGNPNTPDVQSQPYIILAFREMVDKVREEAKRNGCGNTDDIVPDEETEYTAGDRGKVELDGSGKCNVLLKMYKQDGSVWCEKAVRNAVVQPAKDTRLKRYPVALMNWETRKNCCHGVAEVTGLIPNQVYVNKVMALSQLSQMQMSFPKVVYDRTRIREWTNKVAGAIPVNGDIGGAAQYLSPPGVAYDAWRGLDVTLDKTMRMMGANDVTLGSIKNPDNTSAFIAARDAAMVPLKSHQERFYAFVEDIGLIWLDFIRNFYKGGRMIPLVKNGQRIFVPLPDDALDEYAMRMKVEVGPSTMWSEIQVLQTLDNLLKSGKITLKQYLERLPDGHIPLKQELLDETADNAAQTSGQKGTGSQIPAVFSKEPDAPNTPLQGTGGNAAILMNTGAAAGKAGNQASARVNANAGIPRPALPTSPFKARGLSGVKEGVARGTNAGSGQMAQILKLVQAGVQSGDVKQEAAQAIGKLAQSGAGVAEIVEAIKNAAAQGLVSQKFMAELALAMQANTCADPAGGDETPSLQGARGNAAMQANTGADPAGGDGTPPLQGARGNAAMQMNNRKGRKKKNMDSMGQNTPSGAAMPQTGVAVKPEDNRAVMEELTTLLKEGVVSGDADADVPETIGNIISAGAGIAEVLAALKQAMQETRISPLLLAKAEKLLNAAGGMTGAEEKTDRNQILRNNKNMLTR